MREPYRRIYQIIRQTAVRFCRKCGGDVEEATSEGLLWYVMHQHEYDAGRASLETWIGGRLYWHLIDQRRAEDYHRQVIGERVPMPATAERESFDVGRFADGLPEDAALVVGLVVRLDLPKVNGAHLRGWLAGYLADVMEWGEERISQAFGAISGALQEG